MKNGRRVKGRRRVEVGGGWRWEEGGGEGRVVKECVKCGTSCLSPLRYIFRC